ncbi:GNAT family N-acetyltransferase [Psychromonas sp. PT13]|uniref:GNAT family N-acetyltransferase n=1 Tax=Psychromonas sp. PT13 TaxID=3439547 RepID=UPI003EBDBE66
MIEIKTKRLLLRPFQDCDFGRAYQLLSDPEVMRYSLNGPYSKQKSQSFIDQCILKSKKNEPTLFAVIDKKSMLFIGFCGFFSQKIQGKEELELGYRLLKDYWGKGLATEAVMAVKNYAFSELGVTRLISLIETSNIASLRVSQKNGFKVEKQLLYDGRLSVELCVAHI